MLAERKSAAWQPTILKYTQSGLNGIQLHSLRRCAIGYIVSGCKRFYCGDEMTEFTAGSIFYMGEGNHYIEDLPGGDGPFEQVVFYCDCARLGSMIGGLNSSFGIDVVKDHSCRGCRSSSEVGHAASAVMRKFFHGINEYVAAGAFSKYHALEEMKLAELLYMILSDNDSCVKAKILEYVNPEISAFEQIVKENVFNDLSIAELADKCGKSPTSFKKEFRRVFSDSPHKWIIRQRLTQVRLLLVSTSKSISDIGAECMFLNASHFIKLFKKEYGMTPAEFRAASRHYTAEKHPAKRSRKKTETVG